MNQHGKNKHENADSYEMAEGVDEHAIARIDYIASELEKRIDRCFYKDYQNAYSNEQANLEHHYDASISKSTSCSNLRSKTILWRSNSVELITSAQYARKKRKSANGATKNIGYEYLSLANDCLLPHIYKNTSIQPNQGKRPQSVSPLVVPFVRSISPIGMMSLAQAMSFYPKARIIVEVASPLPVVFVNSAYHRLSGLSSEVTLKSPLSRLIGAIDSDCSFNSIVKWIQRMEANAHTTVRIATRSIDSLSGNQVYGQLKCQMFAFPIVADINYAHVRNNSSSSSLHGLRNVTHFLLEFTHIDTTIDFLEDMMDTSVKSNEQAFTLMG